MNMKIRKSGGIYRLQPEGEMSIYTVAAMKTPLIDALRHCESFEIDLRKVNDIDTAGFQLLLLAKREAARLGKPLRLTGHSAATSEMLDLYHFTAHFGEPVAPDKNTHR